MKFKLITFMAICVFLTTCAGTPTPELTQEDQDLLNAINSTDTTFIVSENESDAVWGRVQNFIEEFSSMMIQKNTDTAIETDRPSGYAYGYEATRKTLERGGVEITVSSTCGNRFGARNATQNAKCLAYFAKTGEINPSFIEK